MVVGIDNTKKIKMPKKQKLFTEMIFHAINGKPLSKNIRLKKKKPKSLDAKIISGVKKFLESPF